MARSALYQSRVAAEQASAAKPRRGAFHLPPACGRVSDRRRQRTDMNSQSEYLPKVLFLYGLSSTGKTTFGEYLQTKRGWVFIEVDRYPPGRGDGIDASGLRDPWDHFLSTGECDQLLAELRSRVARAKAPGVIMCFPSRRELEKWHVSRIRNKIGLIYFVGEEEYCVREFMAREKSTGRNLPLKHWHKNNRVLYEQLKDPGLKEYQVDVFNKDGTRKPIESLLQEVEERLN